MKQKTNYAELLKKKAAKHNQEIEDAGDKAPSFLDIKNRKNVEAWKKRKHEHDHPYVSEGQITFKQYLIEMQDEDWNADVDDNGSGVGQCPACGGKASYHTAEKMRSLADAKARWECDDEEGCGYVGRWHHYGE